MKKFKLFLLTGIVSILSIGCFTNANIFGDQKHVYDYRNLVTNNVHISNLHCDGVGNLDISIWGLNVSNGQYEYRLVTKNCPFSVNGDIQWFRVNGLDNHPVVYTYISSTPNSQMQPAIDGLHDTVWEIIPYIVYIGIGVLIVTLGFFAIRWLVNWIGGKINSYFSSKRG